MRCGRRSVPPLLQRRRPSQSLPATRPNGGGNDCYAGMGGDRSAVDRCRALRRACSPPGSAALLQLYCRLSAGQRHPRRLCTLVHSSCAHLDGWGIGFGIGLHRRRLVSHWHSLHSETTRRVPRARVCVVAREGEGSRAIVGASPGCTEREARCERRWGHAHTETGWTTTGSAHACRQHHTISIPTSHVPLACDSRSQCLFCVLLFVCTVFVSVYALQAPCLWSRSMSLWLGCCPSLMTHPQSTIMCRVHFTVYQSHHVM